MEQTEKRRVLSGMRPTGRLHLGNYIGALQNWVGLQGEYSCYFFIADVHALTTDYADPSRIQRNTLEVAFDFLAAGLDPERSVIFVQSHVPQHAELNLLLSMLTPLGWLERVPTYKDQQEQLRAKNLNTYGFLGYPLLQSADILLYKPDFVPVGEDQVSHVELTREVARRFNQFYAGEGYRGNAAVNEQPLRELLPEPKVLLTPSPKLPGLDGRKMSKSYGNFISMSDSLPIILQKTEGMSNGGQRVNQQEPGDPDRCPVGQTHAVFSLPQVNEQIQLGCRTATIDCKHCKFQCGLNINLVLTPIRAKREDFESYPSRVIDILEDGSQRARSAAEETMRTVRDVMGIGSNLRNLSFADFGDHALIEPGTVRQHDLSQHEEWWNEDYLIRARHLRQYWLQQCLPYDFPLKQETESVYLSQKGKRVLITTSHETNEGLLHFSAKPKSYEVFVLLCWQADRSLRDFVIPQKVYVTWWTRLKKRAGKENARFSVLRRGDQYFLEMDESGPINITEYASAYDQLT